MKRIQSFANGIGLSKALNSQNQAEMDSEASSRLAERLQNIVQDVALCRSVCERLAAHAAKMTIPILVEQAGKIALHGTGTLFRIAQSHFVVTAAHVLRQAREHQIPLFTVASTDTEQIFFRLCGDAHCTGQEMSEPFHDGDMGFDAGLLELSSEDVQNLQSHDYVDLRSLANRQAFQPDLYCLLGFPITLATGSIYDGKNLGTITRFCLATTPFNGPASAIPNYRAGRHILLQSKRASAVHLFGDQISVPSTFVGISGCSIWKTNLLGTPANSWTPNHARIIGIETAEYPKSEVLKGTAWHGIASLLFQMHPELQPSLKLLAP